MAKRLSLLLAALLLAAVLTGCAQEKENVPSGPSKNTDGQALFCQ